MNFIDQLQSMFVPSSPPVAGVSLTPTPDTAPQGDGAIAAALKILGQGGKQKEAEALMQVMRPRDHQPEKTDWRQFLFETGLGMMAAGGKPGATFLGAAGEGALAANKNSDRRKREAERRALFKDSQERDALKSVIGLVGDQAKTEFSQDMDKKRLGLSEEQLALQRDLGFKRLALSQQAANRGRFQVMQTPQGTFRINMDTGEASPVMAGDVQLAGKEEFSIPSAMRMATDLVEGSQFSNKPMDFGGAMNEVMNYYNTAKAQRSPAPAQQGGAGGGMTARPRSLEQIKGLLRQKGFSGLTDDQINAWLKQQAGG